MSRKFGSRKIKSNGQVFLIYLFIYFILMVQVFRWKKKKNTSQVNLAGYAFFILFYFIFYRSFLCEFNK